MRAVKLLSVIIILLSIIYFAVGAYYLWLQAYIGKLFAYYGVPADTVSHNYSIATFRLILSIAGSIFLVLGVISLTSSIGLLLKKEWARRIWLIVSISLPAIHLLWIAWCFRAQNNFPEEFLLGTVISLLVIVSWITLNRESVANIFRREALDGKEQI